MLNPQLIGQTGPQPRRLRFSVDDYYKMIDLGMIEGYERSEIIDGEMVPKMTIGDKHAAAVDRLARFFIKRLSDKIVVRIQNPLRLGDFDEPEPDVVLADLTKYNGKRHPRPEETLLVVEVSDTTLRYDRETKLPLYAEAGIREVWIVNIVQNVIEIHREPALGLFQRVEIIEADGTVSSSVLPEISLKASDILS